MSEQSNDRISLCQPDNIKGCSLCCGLFNFSDISSVSLAEFLEGGGERERRFADYNEFRTTVDARDEFSHICPYQGFLSPEKPGCLIHPMSSGADGRGRSLFAAKICGEFFCPAHTLLSEEEKLFLIENINSWYLYSIAVTDPESYSYIYSYVKKNFCESGTPDFSASDVMRVLVNEGLAAHAVNLAAYDGVIFCYSIPEYNLNKNNFCIRYRNETRDLVVSRIVSIASTFHI